MSRRSKLVSASLLALALAAGCGNGLGIEATFEPDAPGFVKIIVKLTNQTECDTTDQDFSYFPDGLPRVALIPLPPQAGAAATAICGALMACTSEECIDDIMMREMAGLGIEMPEGGLAGRRSGSLARTSSTVAAGDCETGPPFLECAFDHIPAGETGMAMGVFEVFDGPDLDGPIPPTVLALASAGATGDDCRPGFEFEDQMWALGGCLPNPEKTMAPLLSPALAAGLIAALLLAGSLALRYRSSTGR